ncbi:MAG: phosphoribosylglycinamide formyltransferase, partial [Hyphomicrobiaceae bacterium]
QRLSVQCIDHKTFPSRDAFDTELHKALTNAQIDLVCCAGFMRLLTADFVERWLGRLLNIHPSLLPAFAGLHPHAQALAAGVRIAGCTVHFVVPETDRGPIVAQAAVPVAAADTAETLAARILAAEHRLYPHALQLVATGAIRFEDGRAIAAADVPAGAAPALFSPPL